VKRIVITSIQAPTASVLAIAEQARATGLGIIVIGDRKSPMTQWPQGIEFLSLQNQRELSARLPALLPENHYARKNIGYLHAVSLGSTTIYDTDDDNAPLASWSPRSQSCLARSCAELGWVNAYSWFSDTHVWPRGLPLTHARQGVPAPALSTLEEIEAPIQQGLANGSPDVDAVWRLLMDREVTFKDGDSVRLAPGTWCPFNSQSTWWFPVAYPLLYLPSFVSFRMTDIWRSFIAQRCLWALGHGVVFHAAEVFQDRNVHNLQRDFEQEVPGYLSNDRFREILEALSLPSSPDQVSHNLHRCYEALIAADLIPATEMPLVECWLSDLGQ